jgi:hypothetical protein
MGKKKRKMPFWAAWFFGGTTAFFVWLTWKKLTEFIGDGWLVWFIAGAIVLIGALSGGIGIHKLMQRLGFE